jgi:hypothetical protein
MRRGRRARGVVEALRPRRLGHAPTLWSVMEPAGYQHHTVMVLVEADPVSGVEGERRLRRMMTGEGGRVKSIWIFTCSSSGDAGAVPLAGGEASLSGRRHSVIDTCTIIIHPMVVAVGNVGDTDADGWDVARRWLWGPSGDSGACRRPTRAYNDCLLWSVKAVVEGAMTVDGCKVPLLGR